MDLLSNELNLLFEKLFKHYLETEFHGILNKKGDYITEIKTTEFLDEYLGSLIKGYINISLSADLEDYLKELLEDEWFFQWPSIQWAHSTRILHGNKRGKKKAIENLFQLAKEGYPGAIYDVGKCYRNGERVERDYKKWICLLIVSSNMRYQEADNELEWEFKYREAKELGIELRFFLLHCLLLAGIRRYNLKIENDTIIESEKIHPTIFKDYKKAFSEYKRLKKTVVEKDRLRSTFELLYGDEDNPYKINY